MKLTLFTLLFSFALSSFATQSIESNVQASEITTYADSTLEHNPPEGIEETEQHFEIDGRKFWIVIDNKRSTETYDESSEVYQYYSQIPNTLLNFLEGVTRATIVYKDTKNIYAVIEIKSE